jgi:hypothetical protein
MKTAIVLPHVRVGTAMMFVAAVAAAFATWASLLRIGGGPNAPWHALTFCFGFLIVGAIIARLKRATPRDFFLQLGSTYALFALLFQLFEHNYKTLPLAIISIGFPSITIWVCALDDGGSDDSSGRRSVTIQKNVLASLAGLMTGAFVGGVLTMISVRILDG